MFAGIPFTLASPAACAAAAVLGIPAIFLFFLRRVGTAHHLSEKVGSAHPTHLTSAVWISAGTLLLIFAAGQLSLMLPTERWVAVMVDLSASTRTAAFRQLDLLGRRIDQLLSDTPHSVFFFSDRNIEGDIARGGALNDLPSSHTVFTPPPCDAVLLFSDGQFPPPEHAPPIYAGLDPNLENAADASITSMRYEGNQLAVSVANNGPPRTLALHGTLGPETETIQGNQTVLRPIDPKASTFWVRLSPLDAWPENDAMSILPPPPMPIERWWIGANAPENWRNFSSDQLPDNATDYLAPSVIVLNNISAMNLPIAAQKRLEQYVRDLGGSLLIFGGDSSFASGAYPGTILESLSPMSSSPPAPRTQWIILADASGSMSQSVTPTSGTRWDKLTSATVDLLPHLPPSDPIRVGQFSDTLRWWSDGKSAEATAQLHLPPSDANPHGPTNLQPVLESIAAAHCDMPRELILLTDADVAIDDTAALSRKLKAARIRVHLLAIDRGSGLAELEDIVRDTGGSFVTQFDFRHWADSVQQLLIGALPDPLSVQPATVQFIGPADAIAGGVASPINSAWPKPGVTPLAQSGDRIVAAMWRNGAGQCAAAAFPAASGQAAALADLLAQPPRDPRLKVSWQTNPSPRVTIDAVDGKTYLNHLDLKLEIWDQQTNQSFSIPQTEPGRYELALPFTSRPAIATIRQGERLIDRFALSGDYDEEFAHIGEDRRALESLARNSGGRVVLPTETTPIDFNWPRRVLPLTPLLATIGAILIAIGLILQRRTARGSASV